MKKIVLLLPIFWFGLLVLNAQNVPQGINYQTIVRGANGSPMPNSSLVLKFEIKDGIGSMLYSEEQSVQSNNNGLVNLIIGQGGTPTFGVFQNIDWSIGPRTLTIYLKNTNSGFDPLGTMQLVSVPYAFYAAESNRAATADQLADLGAQPGQVLQWNGTTWVPANDAVGGGGGSVSLVNTGVGLTGGPISTSGTISLGNTGVTPGIYGSTTKVPQITVDAQGRLSGVIELNVEAPAIALSEGNGIDVAVNGLNNFTVINTGDVDATDDVLKTTQHDGDLIGTYNTLTLKAGVVGTSELANEAVTAAKLDDMGAVNGKVLKYNGSTWAPADDIAGGNGNNYAEGVGINILGSAPNFTIENAGDTDASDDVLKTTAHDGDLSGVYNNLQLKPDVVTAIEIAANAVNTSELANGAVTAAKLDNMGAVNGKVLKFDGSNWGPADDIAGGNGNNYAEGAGIDITGTAPNFTIVNSGDTDPSNDLTTSSSAAGDVTGLFANLQIAGSAVGTSELANGAVTASKLNNMGATFNQVLKFNGTNWGPEDAGLVINGIGSGPGINQNGSSNGVIQINAEIDNAIWNANRLQGRQISANLPATGQVLQWNGTTWAPASVNGNGWEACGEAVPDRVGIGRCPLDDTRLELQYAEANNDNKYGAYFDISGAGLNRGMKIDVQDGSNVNDGIIIEARQGANDTRAAVLYAYDSNRNFGAFVEAGASGETGLGQNIGVYSRAFDRSNPSGEPDFAFFGRADDVAEDWAGYFDGRIGTNEYLQIINPSGNNWRLDVNNSSNVLNTIYNGASVGMFATNGVYTASDKRLKDDIAPLQQMLPKLLDLKTMSYHYKIDPEKKPTFGFIAQDVEKVFPELAMRSKDELGEETLMLNYAGFSVLAIKAIQEQQQLIEAQQSQIKQQEARLDSLEKEMAEIRALLKAGGNKN